MIDRTDFNSNSTIPLWGSVGNFAAKEVGSVNLPNTLNFPSPCTSRFLAAYIIGTIRGYKGSQSFWHLMTTTLRRPGALNFAHLKKPAHAFAIYTHTRSLTDGATSGKSTPRTGRTKATPTVSHPTVRGRCCAPREEYQEKVKERGYTAVTPTAVTKVRAPPQTRSRDSVSEMQSDGGKRGKHFFLEHLGG